MNWLWINFSRQDGFHTVIEDRVNFFRKYDVTSYMLGITYCYGDDIRLLQKIVNKKSSPKCNPFYKAESGRIMIRKTVNLVEMFSRWYRFFFDKLVKNKEELNSKIEFIYSNSTGIQSFVSYLIYRHFNIPYVVRIHGDLFSTFYSRKPYLTKDFLISLLYARKLLFVSYYAMDKNLSYVKDIFGLHVYKYLKSISLVSYNGVDFAKFYIIKDKITLR